MTEVVRRRGGGEAVQQGLIAVSDAVTEVRGQAAAVGPGRGRPLRENGETTRPGRLVDRPASSSHAELEREGRPPPYGAATSRRPARRCGVTLDGEGYCWAGTAYDTWLHVPELNGR